MLLNKKINISKSLLTLITLLLNIGKTLQPKNDITNEIIGANKYTETIDKVGTIPSLAINFKPSANGCSKPKIPTTLGPLLRCMAARTFRSKSV
jgi:hypothetical protein